MIYITCELLWLKNLLIEFGFKPKKPYSHALCNQLSSIAQNTMFHVHSKHIEADSYLVQYDIVKKLICSPFIFFIKIIG